jgi:hypothetical protein
LDGKTDNMVSGRENGHTEMASIGYVRAALWRKHTTLWMTGC